LSLAEALVIAEAVTAIGNAVLAKAAGVGLLDSALQAPQAGFGGHELYPDFVDKAAVLAVRVARNRPLPDGNKRLAWGCLTMFCPLTVTIFTSLLTMPSAKCWGWQPARSTKKRWPSGYPHTSTNRAHSRRRCQPEQGTAGAIL
jgi:hypothetical protein